MENTMRGLQGFNFYGSVRPGLRSSKGVLITRHGSGATAIRIDKETASKFGDYGYIRIGINKSRKIIAIIADDELGVKLQKTKTRSYAKFSNIPELPFKTPLQKEPLSVANGLILVCYKEEQQ